MSKYSKLFILMSLFYLFLGSSIGLLNAFDIIVSRDMLLMHAHYNLLGFMFMMVMGIAYHILPKFLGTFIYFPKLIAPQFWIANIGLILLTTGFHLTKSLSTIGTLCLIIGGLLSYGSVILFVLNLGLTILKPKDIFALRGGAPPCGTPPGRS